MIDTASASKGFIIMKDTVVAQYLSQTGSLCSIPLETWDTGCKAIVEYVSRTLEYIVLGDAVKDKKYGFIESNLYITSNHIKSGKMI
jgi:hypothetical protein